MILSDLSVTRPVLASVIGLLLIAFGVVSFQRLSLREYPDIDPPVVSVETAYVGASAAVVETQITEIIEDRISGIEGIEFIESVSEDGQSRITIEFSSSTDIDAAANDVRDRVGGILDDLPLEADPPEIQKVDSNADVIMWLNLTSDRMTIDELTDYGERYLVDQFSVLDGVARVRVGGGHTRAMRIWLDRNELAARQLTVNDVENALRAENVELPAGSLESVQRHFTIRLERQFRRPEDFASLVIARGAEGYLVRLGDVARVEIGAVENRTFLRGNGIPMVGIGIVKQSTANTLAVARAAKAEAARLNPTLPEGMSIEQSFDTSVFIEEAVDEVYRTLLIAIALVILVIYLFIGHWRATLVPAVTVPVSIIATFSALLLFDFSLNIITLLALVLAIGLVVDDAIVVLENIHRRMDELGETRLVAAFRGTRQVGFAVVATTIVLISVFVPISFIQGDIGRLFSEFALTLAAAVGFSSAVALSVSPMLATKVMPRTTSYGRLGALVDRIFRTLRRCYGQALSFALRHSWAVVPLLLLLSLAAWGLFRLLPTEYTPREDRGTFYVLVEGPEGASFDYLSEYAGEIEQRLMTYVESGEVNRLLVRVPGSFGTITAFNSARIVVMLDDWGKRRPAWDIMNEIRRKLADLPGVKVSTVMRQGFGGGSRKPVQFVLGGGTYSELAAWRDTLLAALAADNPGLIDIDWDYKETKPQFRIVLDYNRAAELGVTVDAIGRTLETMLGSRRVTTYIDDGEEYDVILEGERDTQRSPASLENIQVKSARSGRLIPLANLVSIEEFADSPQLNRYNRVRAITIEAGLEPNLTLGQALDHLDDLARRHLPDRAQIDYKGESRDLKQSGNTMLFAFIFGLIVVYLVLAAQFESYLHPFIIMLTVPLAMLGALFGLWLTGQTLNIFSQIGLIMLVGLAAKNGILIVEFANQCRDNGEEFTAALCHAADARLRPIVMTGITTAAGSVPLVLSAGAGAETRAVLGIVILFGVLAATFFTLFVVPAAYHLIARHSGSPGAVKRQLEEEMAATKG